MADDGESQRDDDEEDVPTSTLAIIPAHALVQPGIDVPARTSAIEELHPLIVGENGKAQRDDVDEATPVSSFSIVPELVPQDEAIPTKPLFKIPCYSLKVNPTIEASLRKPLSIVTSRMKSSTQNLCFVKQIGVTKADQLVVITRRDSQQRDSSKPRSRKLIQQRMVQFKYRRKLRQQPLKSRKRWAQFRRRMHVPSQQ